MWNTRSHACGILGDLCSEMTHCISMVLFHGCKIVVGLIHECIGQVNGIHPAWRSHTGLSVVSVEIQQGLKVRFEEVPVPSQTQPLRVPGIDG